MKNGIENPIKSKTSATTQVAVESYLTPTYGQKAFSVPTPSETIPDLPMSPLAAQRLISDELDMDRVQRGNLSPVFFGSALTNFGVETFLEHFLKMTTTPLSRKAP